MNARAHDPTAPIFERPDGAVLQGRVWNPPAGTEVVGRIVVVHGFSEHAGRYDGLAGVLSAAGYRIVAYDQRGHGSSSGRRGVMHDFGEFVDDLIAVHDWTLTEVEAPGAPILFGHSFGGLVSLRALQTRAAPWQAAILSAPWLATALEVPLWKRLATPVLARVAPRLTLANEIRPERLTRDPAFARAYLDDPLVHHRVSAGLVSKVAEAQRMALVEQLPEGLPLLVLLPGDDRVTDVGPVDEWSRGLSGGQVRVERLAGRRHEPHNDLGREEVFALVVAWLALLQQASSAGG